MSQYAQDVHDHVQQAVHKASPFLEKFARFGYAAKGVVYCLVGGLAVMAAFSSAGQTGGSKDALRTLAQQPFGQVMLLLVAVGLSGYSLWQFIRAVEDPENEGSDGKAILKRSGFFISGVIHAFLVVWAAQLVLGSGGGGDSESGTRSWTAWVMSYPLGQWLIAGIGIGIGLYGVYQIVRAYKAKLGDMLVLENMNDTTRRTIRWISRFGLASRGVVFLIIGGFLVLAAWHENPSEARGLGGALQTLQRQPYGPWILGVVALGLIAYGLYEFVKSRYRRIDVEA